MTRLNALPAPDPDAIQPDRVVANRLNFGNSIRQCPVSGPLRKMGS